MTQEMNTQVDAAVDAGVTAIADAAVVPKVKRTTILKADLTQEYVAARLEVREDRVPVEGGEDLVFENLYWLIDTTAARKGDFAGGRRPTDGYYSVVVAGTNYSGKQLAHFLRTGEWLAAARGRVAGDKVEKEAKVHTPRVFVPLSAEAREAARAAATVKKAQRAAAAPAAPAASEISAVATEDTSVAASTNEADLADLGL